MKLLLAITTLFFTLSSYSQGVPDYDLIENRIKDPLSQYYYPKLMDRYRGSDTTLTESDYYYLYYGYSSQSDYKPLLKTNYADSLDRIFASRVAVTGDVFSKIERYCNAILLIEPFSLRVLNVLAFAYQNMGYRDKAALQMFKVEMLVRAIKSTGTGLTEESPWWITYRESAEDLLNLMDAEPGRQIIITSQIEFVSCSKTTDKRIKGYYFNYSEIYRRAADYLKDADKPKRKLEINPIKPKKYELTK